MPPFKPQELPIKNLNWESFITLIGEANEAVARFDGLLQSILNPNVLLSPLLTNEAVLSSRIEGTQATLQEVFEFEANPVGDGEKQRDIIEILNYRKALDYAKDDIINISLTNRLIRNIHEKLLNSVRGRDKNPGYFRRGQVRVGLYYPPEPQFVPDLMSNLEKYIHSKEKDIFVQLAIIHAQFEMIHPFSDGNGRTGRLLMPLFLYFKKKLNYPAFYLSAYFETNREEYYTRFENIELNGDWDGWIAFFLNAVVEQSRANTQKAKDILQLYNIKKDRISSITHSQFSIKILDFIFSNPVFSSSQFIKYSSIPKDSARNILRIIREAGIINLIYEGKGRAPGIYIFPKLVEIIK